MDERPSSVVEAAALCDSGRVVTAGADVLMSAAAVAMAASTAAMTASTVRCTSWRAPDVMADPNMAVLGDVAWAPLSSRTVTVVGARSCSADACDMYAARSCRVTGSGSTAVQRAEEDGGCGEDSAGVSNSVGPK